MTARSVLSGCALCVLCATAGSVFANEEPVWRGETADWMKFVPDERPLAGIMMPSSHDAAMVEGCCKAILPLPNGFRGLFINQGLSIRGQLEAGSRRFDLRPYFRGDELVSCHVTYVDELQRVVGGTGVSFARIFADTRDFLAEHPTETVFFDISKWSYGGDDATDAKTRAAVREMMESEDYRDMFYRWSGAMAGCPSVNALRIGADGVRGKVVCLWDQTAADPANGVWGWSGSPAKSGCLSLLGRWSDTKDIGYLMEDQLATWAKCRGVQPTAQAYAASWQLTWQFDLLDLANSNDKMTRQVHPCLPAFLKEGVAANGRAMFIGMDYVDPLSCAVVIACNFGPGGEIDLPVVCLKSGEDRKASVRVYGDAALGATLGDELDRGAPGVLKSGERSWTLIRNVHGNSSVRNCFVAWLVRKLALDSGDARIVCGVIDGKSAGYCLLVDGDVYERLLNLVRNCGTFSQEADMATMLMAAQTSEETDLPPELVEAIKDIPFPRTSGDSTGEVIQDVYPKTRKPLELEKNWKERKPKRIFIWSVGEIVKIMDDKTLLNLLKSCGYTIYNDYILPEGREFEIRGFLNKDGVPGCGTLADNLVQIVCPRIENVCTALGEIPSDWKDSFELSIEILGIELIDLDDTYVDWGDIYAVEGALKTLEAVLYLLQGTEIATDDVFALIEKFGEFHGNASDSLILVPQLFKGVRNQEALNKAKASLQSAIGFLKNARTKVEDRTDGRKHLISFKEDGSLLEIAGSAASYVNAALDNLDLLNAALTGTVTLDLKTLLVDKFGVALPGWMKDSYEISLKPIFEGKLNASLSADVVADGWANPEKINLAGFQQFVPSLTMEDVIRLFEVDGTPVRWSWSAYDRYKVVMPYAASADDGYSAGDRSIVATVSGPGELSFAPGMGSAPAGGTLTLYVDGVPSGTVQGGQDGPAKTHWIKGAGEHAIEWRYGLNGNEVLNTAKFHPVPTYALAYTRELETKHGILEKMPDEAARAKVEALCGEKSADAEKVADWISKKGVSSASLAKTRYARASFGLGIGLLDAGAELAKVEISKADSDASDGLSFKINVNFKDAPSEVVKAAAERVSKYIFATGDLGDGFETTVDASRITIGDDGLVTIRPDPKKTAEFFRVVIPADK